MSKRDRGLTKLEQNCRKLERALFLAGLHEDIFAARKRSGKPSVRAVLHEDENVELIGSDEKALDGIYNALTSGKGEVSSTKLRPISEDELVKALQRDQGEAAGKLLGGK